jgi:hypothetical protein
LRPAGVAEGDDGSLDVLDVPVFPPPHATDAASAIAPSDTMTGRKRRAVTQTFRECINVS